MPTNGVFTVLIVDDSPMVVQYLKFIITRRPQFQAIGVFTAEDAFSYLEKKMPDVIILDMNLPGISGVDACKEVRKLDPTLPIIMITADLDPENRFSAYQAGANDFIAKPFNADEIISHIKHHLHLSALDTTQLISSR